MDPRRDYPNFTDAALDFFIRRFPSHPDHAAALAEIERRRTSRKPTVERAGEKTPRVDKAVLIWAVGGIVVLALSFSSFSCRLRWPRLAINRVRHRIPGPRSQ
jgi:hypothetical protein